jgi:hypothetical protein
MTITVYRQLSTSIHKSQVSIERGWNVTAQHLHGVKLSLWLWNRQLQPFLPGYQKCDIWCANESLFASPARWIVHKSPPCHRCLTFNTTVQNQSSSIIAMIESREKSGFYRFLLSAQRTSCNKPRGSPWSSPLRSDGSWDDQVGEAGPVEQSSAVAKSLKLRAKGLSDCYSSEQQPRQPDGGPVGQIKGLLSWHVYKRKESWKVALFWSTKGQKAACQRKSPWIKKDAYSKLRSCSCRREGWSWCRCRWMRTRRTDHKSMRQRFGVWELSLKNGVN